MAGILSLLGVGAGPLVVNQPGDVSGMVARYLAETLPLAEGNPVATWLDETANNNDLTQATGASQPIFHTTGLGGLPYVTFDGTDDFLNNAAPAGFGSQTGLTIIAVADSQTFAGADVKVLASTRSGFNELRLQTNIGATVYSWQSLCAGASVVSGFGDPVAPPPARIVSLTFDNTTNELRVFMNGSEGSAATDSGAFSTTEIMLGSRSGTSLFWKGNISEVCIWARALSGAERIAVENYFRAAYDL